MKNPRRLYSPDAATGGGSALTGAPATGAPATGAPATGAATGTPATGTPATGAITGQSDNKHWTSTYEGLPDNVRSSPALQPFKNPGEALKAYVDVQPLIGADKAPIPKDWNNKEQVAAFNAKLGVPEKAETYDLGKVLTPKLPAGTVLDTKLVGDFQSFALEAGLTPRQAAIVAEKYMTTQWEKTNTAVQAKAVETANALNAFKAERGSAYDTDVAMARKALVNFGDKDVLAKLDSAGLADDPVFIKLFAKVGATLREDTIHPAGAQGQLRGNDADSARVRLVELKADPNFMKALDTVNHPNHKAAVEEWTKVNGMIPAKNK